MSKCAWIFLGLAETFFRFFVSMKLWNWFIPLLFGWSALSYWQAGALSLVASYLTHQVILHETKDAEQKIFVTALAADLVFLILGWTVRLFVR